MSHERHAGRLALSPALLQSLLGIADDARVSHIEFDHSAYQIIVTVEHDEYPWCPEGSTPQVLRASEYGTLAGLGKELWSRGIVNGI